MSIIVALSGGKTSAWCANWVLENYPKEDVILYFNDTHWEHPDLYRFLADLEIYFNHKTIHDDDGRSPEELFYDRSGLANNRMPFCSATLKALRLQRFYKDGDTIVFGIGVNEAHRAIRLISVYQEVSTRTRKSVKLLFPLIDNGTTKKQVNDFLVQAKIEEPILYKLGFTHNNCSGGCVRAGKKQWKLLYDKLPDVYADRERVEREVREWLGKDVHFFKDETLEEFRGRIERGELSSYYDEDDVETECIGICSTMA